eukprot:6469527-Amphidinium_carterae.1
MVWHHEINLLTLEAKGSSGKAEHQILNFGNLLWFLTPFSCPPPTPDLAAADNAGTNQEKHFQLVSHMLLWFHTLRECPKLSVPQNVECSIYSQHSMFSSVSGEECWDKLS